MSTFTNNASSGRILAPEGRPVDVVVVGSLNVDLVSYCSDLPRSGETVIGSSFERHFGGKGANQAVMACRLGGRAAMAGMLGSDAFAADYRAQMQAEGCDISAIGTAPGEASSSGVACITVDGAGRNTIVVVPGANAALAVADVDSRRDLFGGAAVLLCQNEVNIDVTIRALDLAAAAGCLTVFNPAPASAACAAAARHCHVLCPNEVELASLTGLPAESDDQVQTAAFKLLEESPNLLAVVVTLGGRGVCVVQRGEGAHGVTFTAAPKVDVVDTVGAGDCFIGSLGVYLARGADLVSAASRAVRCASLSVTRRGAQTSYPRLGELPAECQP